MMITIHARSDMSDWGFGETDMSGRECRVCGCSELDACVDEAGGTCYWIEQDLCSACTSMPEVA
jgi:hypothetical protein